MGRLDGVRYRLFGVSYRFGWVRYRLRELRYRYLVWIGTGLVEVVLCT